MTPDPLDTSPGRRGRPPKGAPGLTRAAIVEATLKVIDTEGVAAVSMRSVGRALGVDAKSLYNHVDGIDGLLDAVAEQILGGLGVPERSGDTRGDLRAISDSFRDLALVHAEAAALVLTRQLASFEGLAPVDSLLRILIDAGSNPEEAVHLLRFLVATIIGTLLREVSAAPTFGISDAAAIGERETALTDSGLATIRDAAPHLARFDRGGEYEYTVNLAIDAVIARLGAGS
ncbi:TetR/AcrR family transcriptional regulator [Antrihabitans sp. YC2-6]|uniref:TetR/AcrR family transcriptional regulator n=1 Tax=Antrihabitans sp. YC2-6 TaxID=2799498 RepID=UPI0018F35F98|nr:TetR family transcriptional regulator [Antrihabitans sp. YC2-6]MBJ8343834.1 TetR family transcriptional regulator [Antrihabitans sp. YC2-6]